MGNEESHVLTIDSLLQMRTDAFNSDSTGGIEKEQFYALLAFAELRLYLARQKDASCRAIHCAWNPDRLYASVDENAQITSGLVAHGDLGNKPDRILVVQLRPVPLPDSSSHLPIIVLKFRNARTEITDGILRVLGEREGVRTVLGVFPIQEVRGCWYEDAIVKEPKP